MHRGRADFLSGPKAMPDVMRADSSLSFVPSTPRKSANIKFVLKVCLSTLLLAHKTGFAVDGAQAAAGRFYQRYQSLRTSSGLAGIPSPGQLLRLSPSITPQLRALLAAAYQEQMRCKTLFPEDVPPWVGGDIFSSNVEGFTVFDVASSRARPWGRAVSVRFTYGEGKEKVMWTDTLMLNEVDGAWLVDDISYRATFAFTSGFGTHLQGSLKEVPAC